MQNTSPSTLLFVAEYQSLLKFQLVVISAIAIVQWSVVLAHKEKAQLEEDRANKTLASQNREGDSFPTIAEWGSLRAPNLHRAKDPEAYDIFNE